jgi:hypothetical protein
LIVRLTELDPRWFTMGSSPDLVGITFECPHCVERERATGDKRVQRIGVLFREEIDRDGLPNEVHWTRPGNKWHREGDTFETLTLSPSVDASSDGHWHGFIRNGEVT